MDRPDDHVQRQRFLMWRGQGRGMRDANRDAVAIREFMGERLRELMGERMRQEIRYDRVTLDGDIIR